MCRLCMSSVSRYTSLCRSRRRSRRSGYRRARHSGSHPQARRTSCAPPASGCSLPSPRGQWSPIAPAQRVIRTRVLCAREGTPSFVLSARCGAVGDESFDECHSRNVLMTQWFHHSGHEPVAGTTLLQRSHCHCQWATSVKT